MFFNKNEEILEMQQKRFAQISNLDQKRNFRIFTNSLFVVILAFLPLSIYNLQY